MTDQWEREAGRIRKANERKQLLEAELPNHGRLRVLIARPDPHPEWRDKAACRGCDDDLFFPATKGEHSAEAKAVCAGCPVREPCLEYALAAHEKFGLWGGLSPEERRLEARRRNRARRFPA